MSIVSFTHTEMERVFEVNYASRMAMFMHGKFGIGKSRIIKDFGRTMANKLKLTYSENFADVNDEEKFVCLVIPLHQYDAASLKIPTISKDSEVIRFLRAGWLPSKGQGIIFFDELNLAPPLVQANSYQLILDRRLEDYILPEGYVCWGAGNTASDGAHIYEMAMPLRNRFGHVELLPPSVDDWVSGFALKNGIDHRITMYLKFVGDEALFRYKADSDEDLFAIATPRTWEFCSHAIAGIDDIDFLRKIAGMYVGVGDATALAAHITMSSSYDISKMWAARKIGTIPNEVDKLYALMSGLISHYMGLVREKKCKHSEAEVMFDLAAQFSKEHRIFLMSYVKAAHPEFLPWVMEVAKPKFVKFSAENLKLII